MIKVILLFVTALSFGYEYIPNLDEKTGIDWMFGDDMLFSLRVRVGEGKDYTGILSFYDSKTDTVYVNPDMVDKFRGTLSIIHEAAHRYQKSVGIFALRVMSREDYIIPDRLVINTERQAEAARILTIEWLRIKYKPQVINDDLLYHMSIKTRRLLWSYLVPLGLSAYN
jgi:hypothetical protein